MIMKKTRKTGNRTDSNFFISDFKLRASQTPRQHKKLSSTGNHFKQHNLFQDSRRSSRQLSKEGKPPIDQLKFINPSGDYFKLPKSLTKRSVSKKNESQRSRLQRINNEMYENMLHVPEALHGKKSSVGYMDSMIKHRKFKTSSVSQMMKQKLEKTALQRFNDATRGNEENQSGNSEKKAEALYNFLRGARTRMDKNNRNRYHNTQESEMAQNKNKESAKITQNQRSSKEIGRQKKSGEQMNRNVDFHETIASGKEGIFSKKAIDAPTRETNNQRVERKSREKQEHQFVKEVPDLFQSWKQSRMNTQSVDGEKPQIQIQNIKKPDEIKTTMNIVEQTLQQAKKSNQLKSQQLIPPKSRKGSDKISVDGEKNNKIYKKQEFPRKQQLEIDILLNVPQIKTVADDGKDKKQRKNSEKAQVQVNQHNIEKVLTARYLENQSQNKQSFQTNAVLAAPPQLKAQPATPKAPPKRVQYKAQEVEQQQLEEIGWNGKQKQKIKPIIKPQEPSQTPSKSDNSKGPLPTLKNPQEQKPKPQTASEQPQNEALDALIFYIEKIQDIGQYRLNSRDIYNDKDISKELLNIHKICSYYMAHQFLFLTKRFFDILKSPTITKNIFQISAEELILLKSEGQIDPDIETLQGNMQESKKLLQKCYKDCKEILKEEQRILLLDGKSNYHRKCCMMLKRQFEKIYTFYKSQPKSHTIKKRCCFLIEIYCTLMMMNGQELKQSEDIDQIDNLDHHISTYKHILIQK